MNREILFRGKRIDNGEWIVRSIIEVVGDKVFIDYIEVIPETVGQFTGSIDNNGTRIFEGDYDKDFGFVFWDEDSFCWSVYKDNSVMPFNRIEIAFKVTGNIHDNEL